MNDRYHHVSVRGRWLAALAIALGVALGLGLGAQPQTTQANTLVVTLGDQDFADGTFTDVAAFNAASAGEPAPFDQFRGNDGDPGDPFTATWKFTVPEPNVTFGILVFGICDLDGAAAGDQVTSFTIDGVDDPQWRLDILGANTTQGECNVFAGPVPVDAMVDGSVTFSLTLQGPSLGGTAGSSDEELPGNGAGLDFATLQYEVEKPEFEIPRQLLAVEAKKLSAPADRLDIAFGKPDKADTIIGADAVRAFAPGVVCIGRSVPPPHSHVKDANPDPALPHHEILVIEFIDLITQERCFIKSGETVVIEAFPLVNTERLIIKEATFYNTQGTPELEDDVPVGAGNAVPLDFSKVPRRTNLWLCTEPSSDPHCNVATFAQVVGQPIRTADPKCVGFPNFQDPATCPRQQLTAIEYEIRFDAKYVEVTWPSGELIPSPPNEPMAHCLTNYAEGIAQIACVDKDEPSVPAPSQIPGAFGPPLIVEVTPKPDVYSILRASQENGIVVGLINQDCNFADQFGHPIPIGGEGIFDPCSDAAVTIRYLEGDVHADCVVDVRDQQQIAFRWGSHLGSLLYNEHLDLEPSAPKLGDGDIDAKDLQFVYGRHGSTCADPHPNQIPVDPKAKVEPPSA